MKNIAEILALGIGGAWTYLLFVRGRQKFPRAKLEHTVTTTPLDAVNVLLHVAIGVENPGNILLSFRAAEVRVCQVRPVPETIQSALDDGLDPVTNDRTDIPWPIIAERILSWERGEFQIEPGERDVRYFDFVLASNIEAVEIYSYFGNSQVKGIGWHLATIYDVSPAPLLDAKKREKDNLVKRDTFQQRKKPKPAPPKPAPSTRQQKPKPKPQPEPTPKKS